MDTVLQNEEKTVLCRKVRCGVSSIKKTNEAKQTPDLTKVIQAIHDFNVDVTEALREFIKKTMPTIKELAERYGTIKPELQESREELRAFIEQKEKYNREVIYENNAYRRRSSHLQAPNRSMVRRSEKNQKQRQGR